MSEDTYEDALAFAHAIAQLAIDRGMSQWGVLAGLGIVVAGTLNGETSNRRRKADQWIAILESELQPDEPDRAH